MDNRFLPHNLQWESLEKFYEFDPQLRNLKKQPYVHRPALIQKLPFQISGIYTLGGGRQIGKTTLLKQWMSHLLQKGISPSSIFFLTGEIVHDHLNLIQTIQEYLEQTPSSSLRYIIVDEVTYIKEWDQGIKYLADLGAFENVVIILTGSDLTFIKEARMRFPGRRGIADQVDFHLYPLSFFEFVNLKIKTEEMPPLEILFQEFESYLHTGGFLTAINDLKMNNRVSPAIYRTYSDWIRGDVIKRGKSESYLREFLGAIITTYGTQITWNALAHHTSIDHPTTIQTYAQLLEDMDVLFIQSALMEDKLLPAPKKAKKIIFKDPFIHHAIRSWVFPSQPLHTADIPSLVESSVISHYQRFYPCFYIKAEGEVDLAYVEQNKFFPIEVKWTQQLRSKDLKQIQKYTNSRILTKTLTPSRIGNTPTEPLPLHLYQLGKEFDDFTHQLPLDL